MADRIDPRLHYVGQLPPPSQHRPPEAPAVPQPFANPPPHQLQNDSVLPQQPYFMTSSPTTSRPLPLPNPLHPPPPPPPPPHSHPNSHPHSHSHSQQLHSASAVDPALESTSPVHASPTDDGNEPDHEDDYGAYVLPSTAPPRFSASIAYSTASDHTQVGSPADSIKRPRACDSCRGLKVRVEICGASHYFRADRVIFAGPLRTRPYPTQRLLQAMRKGKAPMVSVVRSRAMSTSCSLYPASQPPRRESAKRKPIVG